MFVNLSPSLLLFVVYGLTKLESHCQKIKRGLPMEKEI